MVRTLMATAEGREGQGQDGTVALSPRPKTVGPVARYDMRDRCNRERQSCCAPVA